MSDLLRTLLRDVSRAAKRKSLVALAFFAFALTALAQDEVPTFKVGSKSALVWDKEFSQTTTASIIWDPLTGNEIHKLSSRGIEVSSRIGYERVGSGVAGELLNYTTIIANNTNSDVTVQYGGSSADGHTALLLWVALTDKGLNKRDRKSVWQLSKMHCFKTGFASNENFFSAHVPSRTFTVRAQTAITISWVTKDPRRYSVRCALDGCHVTGTVRYYVRVNNKDYVFVWPGQSVVYCGE